jgi:aspartate-semialdehyde dehydrogenase
MVLETLAVVGATGAVGGIVRQLLEQRNFPLTNVKFIASARSAGKTLTFRDQTYTRGFDAGSFRRGRSGDCQHAGRGGGRVHSLGGRARRGGGGRERLLANEAARPAGHSGGQSGSDSRASGDHCQPQLLDNADGRGPQAAARCSSNPPSGRQHLSGNQRGRGGRPARSPTRESGGARRHVVRLCCFPHPIAFNLIPQIGSPKHGGYTSEEMKMVWETQKILGDDSIRISPTCVRVPVANCHSESILVETERSLSAEEACEVVRRRSRAGTGGSMTWLRRSTRCRSTARAGRSLRWSNPPGSLMREWHQLLVRERQFAEGSGDECRPDRRAAGRPVGWAVAHST